MHELNFPSAAVQGMTEKEPYTLTNVAELILCMSNDVLIRLPDTVSARTARI